MKSRENLDDDNIETLFSEKNGEFEMKGKDENDDLGDSLMVKCREEERGELDLAIFMQKEENLRRRYLLEKVTAEIESLKGSRLFTEYFDDFWRILSVISLAHSHSLALPFTPKILHPIQSKSIC